MKTRHARWFVAWLAVLVMLYQIPSFAVQPPPIHPPSNVSTSIMHNAAMQMVAVNNKIRLGKPVTAIDYAASAAKVEAVFSNWQETQYDNMLRNWVIQNQLLFTSQQPTLAELHTGYLTLKKADPYVIETESQYDETILGLPFVYRERFLFYVEYNDMPWVHAQVVNTLNALAAVAERSSNGGIQQAFFLKCDIPWLGITSTYLGIVALFAGPAGPAIGLISLGLGGIGLLTGC